MNTLKMRRVMWGGVCLLVGLLVLLVAAQGCGSLAAPQEGERISQTRQAVSGLDGGSDADPLPCLALNYAVLANGSSVFLNSGAIVDSYQSSLGAYGGSNMGSAALVQAATSITNNGGTLNGREQANSTSGMAVVPAPSGAIPLPLGSKSAGSLVLNTGSLVLAPGDYVAANVTLNAPGTLTIAPAGLVRIWVTGSLNLGGLENSNEVPDQLAFLVTSSVSVNVNARGALYGILYAPSAAVNVNSPVFGSIIGSSVTLNSGAAVHEDESFVCAQTGASLVPSPPDPLPAPPTAIGCYVWSQEGWQLVPCQDPASFGLTGSFNLSDDGLATKASFTGNGEVAPQVVYGQVGVTIESISSETNLLNDASTPNMWGIQANSNEFLSTTSPTEFSAAQFAIVADSNLGTTAVCIEVFPPPLNNNTAVEECVGLNGQTVNAGSGSTAISSRKGPLKPFDFANVASYAYSVNNQALMAVVGQFSWVLNQNLVPLSEQDADIVNQIPGLYAVVIADQYGLAQGWTSVTGSIMGYDLGAEAVFKNAKVLSTVALSSCPGDVSPDSPTCPLLTNLTSANVAFTSGGPTEESSNLFPIQTAVAIENSNYAITETLASDNLNPTTVGSASCLSSDPPHLFIRDREGDNGGTPSNVGGLPFWKSPDIFVLPVGTPAPFPGTVATDSQLNVGQPYNVYLQVHNDFGCAGIPGPIQVFVDIADPDLGLQNWLPVTRNAGLGQYQAYPTVPSSVDVVGAYSPAILGPFGPFTPTRAGHKCLLAAVAAGTEAEPTVTIQPGQPVLPSPAKNNQIAQRNLQIDSSSCSFNITNNTSSALNLSLSLSVDPVPLTPPIGAIGGAKVSLTFSDPTGAFFAAWQTQPNLGVTTTGGPTLFVPNPTTTVLLNTSQIALNQVSLPAEQTPSVTIRVIPATASTTPPGPPVTAAAPIVNITSVLTDPMTGDIISENGGTCQITGQAAVAPPPPH